LKQLLQQKGPKNNIVDELFASQSQVIVDLDQK